MAYRKIKLARADGVATVTLADPATLNAAALDMVEELIGAFAALAADDQVRAVVLTGEGRGFCSGANLNDDRAVGGGSPDLGIALETHYRPFIEAIRTSPAPVVCAVNGVCAGIGVAFALACDLVIAAENASFILAFRRIGLVPDGGLTWLLPRLVGKARALELILLGDALPAPTALQWGLINRTAPEGVLAATAAELAQRLAAGPKSLRLMRRLIWDGLDATLAEQQEAERAAQTEAGRTADFREGLAAFAEKRPTRFTGQ